jgi:hypothetical protein
VLNIADRRVLLECADGSVIAIDLRNRHLLHPQSAVFRGRSALQINPPLVWRSLSWLLPARSGAGIAFFCQRDAPNLALGFFSGCIRHPVFSSRQDTEQPLPWD